MSIRRTAAAIALVMTVSSAAVEVSGARADDKDITLSGCLVRAEDGDGYLLTNMPGEPAWQRSADVTILPGAVGTTGSFATIFYWIDDHGDLKKHVGHLVAVEGDLKGDLEEGEIKIERKDKWTEECTVRGRFRVQICAAWRGPAGLKHASVCDPETFRSKRLR